MNYLCDRLPWERSLGAPLCHHCGKQRRWSDFLLMRACSHCNRKVGWRAYIVLLLSLGFSLFLLKYGIWHFLILEYFLLVAMMDIEHRVILHPVSIAGAILAVTGGVQMHGWLSTILGGVIGGSLMAIFYLAGLYYGRWVAKRQNLEQAEEGLGFGDVTLSFILGLALGASSILAGLTLGIFLAGIFSLGYLLLTRQSANQATIPYAPFLLIGAALLLVR
ncbi:MAG: prepilin peptidase [Anaerolineales bacterium]